MQTFFQVHTYNRITEILEEIHLDSGLSNKNIVLTMTDNGSNFVKAFEEFNISVVANDENYETEDDGLSCITIHSLEEDVF